MVDTGAGQVLTLLLIGAGGHGRAIADLANSLRYTVNFFDDGWPDREINGVWPIIGNLSSVASYSGPIFVSVGDNPARSDLWKRFSEAKASPALIHPTAIVSSHATFGDGTAVMPGAIANFGSSIGRGVIINTGARIDHDCTIGNMVHLSPGSVLAGSVKVGDRSWIGAGAIVIEGVSIGQDVTVGAGSVVIRDVPDGARVCGVPARPMKGKSGAPFNEA